ncbi:hypothetical protein ACWA1F_04750 [Flavobacterium sp. 3-218]
MGLAQSRHFQFSFRFESFPLAILLPAHQGLKVLNRQENSNWIEVVQMPANYHYANWPTSF